MGKVGRNEPCACGSGLKYKKCCLVKTEARATDSPSPAPEMFVTREVERLQQSAAKQGKGCKMIGTFIFFASGKGDAWLLELTERDAAQVARRGEPVHVAIEESEESLEIGWTHSFAIEGHRLVTTAYQDQAVATHSDAPVVLIKDALAKIKRKFTPEQLSGLRTEE